MLSKRIQFITITVSCSLVGIFLFQGYWLYNSYQLSAKQFNADVSLVLQKTQTIHAINDLKSMGIKEGEKGVDRASLIKLANFMQSVPDQLPEPDSGKTKKKKVESTLEATLVYSLKDSARSGKVNDSSAKVKPSVNSYRIRPRYEYSNVELVKFGKALKIEIDSLLKANGIYSSFAFKIFNYNRKGSNYIYNEKLYKEKGERLEQKIGVLKPYVLSLSVNNSLLYPLKKMQWILIASLLIVGVTLFAFIYMLRTIFHQKRLSEVKNDFINNMTHEFKTPIATVSLAVEAMKNFDVLNKPEQAKEYLDICQHELNRISTMVEKVLKAATFERSEVKLSLQKTNIGQLINDVVGNMRPQLEQNTANLSIKALNGTVEAMIDPDHFSNLIYNLIDNGLKYSKDNPEISISYGKGIDENMLELIVSDNGIGIPTAYQDKVFDSFFRVPKGNIHEIKGFGLGLSYVASIVKSHGGTIKLKSIENKGTSFIINLPLS